METYKIMVILLLCEIALNIALGLVNAWVKRDTERMIDEFCKEQRNRDGYDD